MAGWIKMPLGTKADLGPGHSVLHGDAAHRKRAQPPIFGPCLLWPNGCRSQLLLSTCANLYKWSPKNGWTDLDAILDLDSNRSREDYMGCRMPPREEEFSGVWPTEKHYKAQDFEGWVIQRGVQKTDRPFLRINTLYDMSLCKLLPFGGHDDCICIKIFRGTNFCVTVCKKFTLCYWTVVCPVLSVTLVYCSQMLGQIKITLC